MAEAREKIYPRGIIFFAPNENAPEWALGDMVINLDELGKWVKENPEHITDYKGMRQLKLSVTTRDKRLSCNVNTYKKKEESFI